ncbi:MAG TPA: hypothetical protein VII06_09340 [Chloroflexota bacterium]
MLSTRMNRRMVAVGAALGLAVGGVGLWAGVPTLLAGARVVQPAGLGAVAPARVAAAELAPASLQAPAAPAAPRLAPLGAAVPSLAEARARWLASGAAERLPDASQSVARHPEP